MDMDKEFFDNLQKLKAELEAFLRPEVQVDWSKIVKTQLPRYIVEYEGQYELNEEVFDKFAWLLSFLLYFGEKEFQEVVLRGLNPEDSEDGSITIALRSDTFSIVGSQYGEEFKKIFKMVDGFSVETIEDGERVEASFVLKNFWEECC